MKLRLNAIATIVVGAVAFSPLTAFAHPALVRSDPAAGGKGKAPDAITLRFSEKIEPVFNKIEVLDASGAHFEEGKAALDPSNKAVLHVRLKSLPVGSYTVQWRVSAADSHKMEGSFRFEVAP